ncbi:40S ribosomal protein S2 [Cricetulus griseus]|uniref:40S ribosomal protein S2 n=1 Tax=Cricetulus griseus TaxID=10029 RepID=G3I331_CRIGR|nr:40S ribosomal protein S2 [Cricetulus griseus]
MLGRLVKDMKIKSLEALYLPIKAFVDTGDYNGHVGLGVKCSKERHWHPLCSCAQEATLMANIDNCYTSARGYTASLGNFAKATFDATSKTYSYLIPNLWKETVFTKSPSLTTF